MYIQHVRLCTFDCVDIACCKRKELYKNYNIKLPCCIQGHSSYTYVVYKIRAIIIGGVQVAWQHESRPEIGEL